MTATRIRHALTLALGCLLLAGCGGGDGGSSAKATLPDKAFTDDVVGVTWMSAQAMSADNLEASAMALIDAIPAGSEQIKAMTEQMRAGLAEGIASHRDNMGELTGAGVEGVLIGMIGPDDPEGQPSSFALVKVKPGADLNAVQEALAKVEGGVAKVELEPYAEGWLAAKPRGGGAGGQIVAPPTDGSAENAAAFSDAMAGSSKRIPFSFRINDEVRQQLRDNPPPQLQPLAAPLTKATDGSVDVTLGKSPALNVNLNFGEAAAASEFASTVNGLMALAQGQLKSQLMNAPEPPDAERISALFDRLKIKADGSAATMSVNIKTIQDAMAIAEDAGMMEQLPMMLMMFGGGMMGPGDGGPMGPGGHGGGPMPPMPPGMDDGGGADDDRGTDGGSGY